MPFQSEAQQRFMWMKHPDIAKRWADKYGTPKNLPYHKAGTMKTKSKSMLSPKGRAAMMKVKGSKSMPPAMKRALIKKIMASESAKAGGAPMSTGKGKQKAALSQLFSTMNQS